DLRTLSRRRRGAVRPAVPPADGDRGGARPRRGRLAHHTPRRRPHPRRTPRPRRPGDPPAADGLAYDGALRRAGPGPGVAAQRDGAMAARRKGRTWERARWVRPVAREAARRRCPALCWIASGAGRRSCSWTTTSAPTPAGPSRSGLRRTSTPPRP